jgi:hypothetical protein
MSSQVSSRHCEAGTNSKSVTSTVHNAQTIDSVLLLGGLAIEICLLVLHSSPLAPESNDQL